MGIGRSISRRAFAKLVPATAALFASGRVVVGAAQTQSGPLPGKIAFIRKGNIWSWSGGEAREVLTGGNISDPRWSPDGESLIYVKTGNSFSDLYTYNTFSTIETQLTFNEPPYDLGSIEYADYTAWVIDPDWARTGLIGFMSDKAATDAYLGLWLMPSIDSEPYYALEPGVEEDISGLCLSSDGTFASYTVRVSFVDGTRVTYVALRDLNTGAAASVAESRNDIFDSAISPDGQWIAITIRSTTGTTDLWIVERATGERSRMTRDENAMAPRWSDDGQWLGYIRMNDFEFEIWAASFANGKISGATKIYDEDGIDSQSGLSWYVPLGETPATPTP